MKWLWDILRRSRNVAASGVDSLQAGTAIGGALAALGITLPFGVSIPCLGTLILAGISCKLYEEYVEEPDDEERKKKERNFAIETREKILKVLYKISDAEEQRSKLGEVLDQRIKERKSEIAEPPLDHPLRAAHDIAIALSEDDGGESLSEQLKVHDSFEAALLRFLELEFETVKAELSLTQGEINGIRGTLKRVDSRLSVLDCKVDVLTNLASIDYDLELPIYDYDHAIVTNPFLYNYQRVPLYGRTVERRELLAFLESGGASVQWWLWHGPGGQGKSRLAQEFCLDARARGWAAGFIRRGTDLSDWQRFNLRRNSLVIIDYVGDRPAATAGVIARTYNRYRSSPHKLRFLLLERSAQGPWREDFDRGRSGPDPAALLASRFKWDDRALSAIGDEYLRQIFAFVFRQREKPSLDSRAAFEVFSNRLDPEHKRPLYAAIAADVMADLNETVLSGWDGDQLFQHVLTLELNRWAQMGVDSRHLNALVLATMLGRLEMDRASEHTEVSELRSAGVLPAIQERNASHWARLAAFAQGKAIKETEPLPGVQPDILAECFVLGRLKGDLLLPTNGGQLQLAEGAHNVKQDARALLDTAWAIDAEQVADFTRLCLRDFPSAALSMKMLAVRDETAPQRAAWAALVTTASYLRLLGIIGTDADSQWVDYALDELEEMALGRNAEPPVREWLANTLTNAVVDCGPDFAHTDGLLDQLRELRREHEAPPTTRSLAMALANAVVDCGADFARTDGLLEELRDLRRGDDEPAVRESVAMALTNAVASCESDFDRADGLLDELRDLRRDHNEPRVRELFAKALRNAVTDCRPDFDRADGLLDELRDLRRDHDEPPVREEFAIALNNAVAYCASEFKRADKLLSDLRDLRRDHDEPPIRESLAMVLNNAVGDSGPDFARTDELLDELRDLRREHDEPSAREQLARALCSRLYSALKRDLITGSADLAEEIVSLRGDVLRSDASPVMRRILQYAIDAAVRLDDRESHERLKAASRAIFGDGSEDADA